MDYYYTEFDSPLGAIYIIAQDQQVCAVSFEKNWDSIRARFSTPTDTLTEKRTPLLVRAKQQLTEYFKGQRQSFDLPYTLTGTLFQNKVWKALAQVPYGETKSYKQHASSIKSPRAVRAVGRTNGLNPLAILLPCHRIIGSNGALTGYAGGIEAKKFLLNLEGISI